MTQILGNLFIDFEDSTLEDETGGHTVNLNGNSTVTNNTSVFGTSSLYVDGSLGTLDYAYIDYQNDLDFGTNNFTIDCWLKAEQSQISNGGIFEQRDTDSVIRDLIIYLNTADQIGIYAMDNGALFLQAWTQESINIGSWNHVAITRYGTDTNNLRIFINGLETNMSFNHSLVADKAFPVMNVRGIIGHSFGYDGLVNSYIDNFRIVNGQALWTENFDLTEEALFYKSASNYIRPGTVRGMYNLSSKKGNLRGKAKSGFVRPTISQFFTSKNFEEVESFSDYKSVILDIADNYGGSRLGLVSVDFWYDSTKITNIRNNDFVAYATSSLNTEPEDAFDTRLMKTGDFYNNPNNPESNDNGWQTSNLQNQRLICVFNSPIKFDEIRINNFNHYGSYTDRGVKNVKITASTDPITDVTYNASILNSTVIFDGIFNQHVSQDVEDEQIITLL